MSPRSKERSTNFAFILILFLIMSTVIVFTVILVLSFETNLNSTMVETENSVNTYSEAIAASIESVVNTREDIYDYGQDTSIDEAIVRVLSNSVFNENGTAYLYNSNGERLYPDYDNDATGDLIDEAINISVAYASNHGSSKSKIEHEGITSFLSISHVKGTGMYCCFVSDFDYSEAVRMYLRTYLVPMAIAFLFAIALFTVSVWIMLGPIRDFSRVIGCASNGDYSQRVNSKYIGSRSGVFTLTSDISMMGKTINSMNEKLENQEKDRSVFVSSIAHDIRTPVTSIKGFTTAMIDGVIEHKDYTKYLELIKQQSERIGKLVTSMTEASSLSSVNPELMEKFDAKEMISDIVENLTPQLSEKNIEITKDFDTKNEKLMAYGDAQQLCRVIQNIISNAVKFTPEDGEIIVSCYDNSSQNNIIISVEDSGCGIPEDKMDRVFESFYKVDSSRKKEGFGLGLYICKQILQAHNQSISVSKGEELGGAKFEFSFPKPEENE